MYFVLLIIFFDVDRTNCTKFKLTIYNKISENEKKTISFNACLVIIYLAIGL